LELDHIKAKMFGGKETPQNSQLVHQVCHQTKTAKERIVRAKASKQSNKDSSGQAVKKVIGKGRKLISDHTI